MNPKVFVSHASEDKERFVLEFATKLRNCGIDAWLDKWEMLPGDSLVDKIFEEGIKNADAMIIVISKYSILKKWVIEELNAGFIKKLEKNTKLIPVIIDDCRVPEALKSTVWQHIKDLKNYTTELEIIKNSIFGTYSKPELGEIPNYVTSIISEIPDYTKEDTIILKETCEKAMKDGIGHFNVNVIKEIVKTKYDISDEIIKESIEILDNRYCYKSLKTHKEIIHITLTTYGFKLYAEHFLESYDKSIDEVAFFIVNSKNNISDSDIQKGTNINLYLTRHILDLLENKAYINLIRVQSGASIISTVNPELKRLMKKK